MAVVTQFAYLPPQTKWKAMVRYRPARTTHATMAAHVGQMVTTTANAPMATRADSARARVSHRDEHFCFDFLEEKKINDFVNF